MYTEFRGEINSGSYAYIPSSKGHIIPIGSVRRDSIDFDSNKMQFSVRVPRKSRFLSKNDFLMAFNNATGPVVTKQGEQEYLVSQGMLSSIDGFKVKGSLTNDVFEGRIRPLALLGFLDSNYPYILGCFKSGMQPLISKLVLLIDIKYDSYMKGATIPNSHNEASLIRKLKAIYLAYEKESTVIFLPHSSIKEFIGCKASKIPKFYEFEEREMFLKTVSSNAIRIALGK